MEQEKEIVVYALPENDFQVFESVHGYDDIFSSVLSSDGFGNNRELMGWYVRKSIRVKFYYKPNWFRRQKMYWIYGWTWEDKVKDEQTET